MKRTRGEEGTRAVGRNEVRTLWCPFIDLAVAKGVLYGVHGADGCIYSRKIQEPSWTRRSGGSLRAVAVDDCNVWVVMEDGGLYMQSVSTKTEATMWSSTWSPACGSQSWSKALAVAVGAESLYVVGTDLQVYSKPRALISCQQTMWRLCAKGWVTGIAVNDKALCGVAPSGDLMKHDPDTDTWGCLASVGMRTVAADGDILYGLGLNGHLYRRPREAAAWEGLGPVAWQPRLSPRLAGDTPTLRLVCISDTHGHHRSLELPPGDVLVHAGDLTEQDDQAQLLEAAAWFVELRDSKAYGEIVAIAGNHDKGLEASGAGEEFAKQAMCAYLEDKALEVGPTGRRLTVYGTPWQPQHGDRATNAFSVSRGEEQLQSKWKAIPEHTDVLVVHGPPSGQRDLCWDLRRVGCETLLEEVVDRVRPRVVVFGHIHEAFGWTWYKSILFVNASSECGYHGANLNPPVVIDLPLDLDKKPVVVSPTLG